MVEKTIKTILKEKCGLEGKALLPGASFSNDLNLSPLEMADLFSQLEEKFKIQIADEETSSIETLSDLVHLIQDKTNEIA